MRVILFGLLCFLCHTAIAGPVDKKKAQKIATALLCNDITSAETSVQEVNLNNEVRSRISTQSLKSPSFYIFASTAGEGFAIISGDDNFPEIIGYSKTCKLEDASDMPEALIAYLEAYSHYVDDVRIGIAKIPATYRAVTDTIVAPLCTTKWGQGTPFNTKCPQIDGSYAPVGCMATAMAQIMRYWRFPERATGKVAYNTENSSIGVIDTDLSTDEHIYNWDAMKDRKESMVRPSSYKDVAQLSYDCGVAAKMKYNLGGSGTSDANGQYALYNNFGYSRATTQLIFRNFVSSQTVWNDMILKELKEGRPIIYCGSSTKGSGSDAAGHAFIFDGYDSEGNVHVNWGWNGSYDGYYSIVTLDMGEYAFSETQSMIYGIKPGKEGETLPQSRLLVFHGAPVADAVSTSLNKKFIITLPDFYNYDAISHSWKYSVGLFDKHGKFIENIVEEVSYENFIALNGYHAGKTLIAQIPSKTSNGKELAEGDYVLRFIINEKDFNSNNGSENWILPYCQGGDDSNWLPVEIKGGKAYFDQVSSGIQNIQGGNDKVKSVDYFDLSGRNIKYPSKGMFLIERQTMSTGKVRSFKRWF